MRTSQTLASLGFAPDETIADFYSMGSNPEPIADSNDPDFDPSLGSESEQRAYYELLMGRMFPGWCLLLLERLWSQLYYIYHITKHYVLSYMKDEVSQPSQIKQRQLETNLSPRKWMTISTGWNLECCGRCKVLYKMRNLIPDFLCNRICISSLTVYLF